MNEPKKRGRPRKVDIEPEKNASIEGDDLPTIAELLARIEKAEKRADEAEKRIESLRDAEALAAEREAELDRKAMELHEQQQKNRTDPARLRALLAPRDPSIIRKAKGVDLIEVVTKARIGLTEDITTDIDETVFIPKEVAKKLQEDGKVKIKL